MKKRQNRMIAAGLGALLLAGASVTAQAATEMTAPSVIVRDQSIADRQITLDYAFLPEKGYAVVYGTGEDGKPIREPIGHVELDPGDHRNVMVELEKDVPTGNQLWVSLYADKGNTQGFDPNGAVSFWDGDLPAMNLLTVQ